MGTTANQSYPYPAGSDAVDVPGDIQALADAVDSDVAAIEANDWVTTARIDDGAVTLAKLEAQYVAKSAAYTLTAAESVVDVTGTTTVTLPAAASHTGRVYIIRNTGTATVTVSGITNLAFAGKGSATVVSDGSAWTVISASYTDESVGRRVFTWNPDLATPNWQMTFGDTGVRDVVADLANSFTANEVQVRRAGSTVFFTSDRITDSNATAVTFYTLPVGFRPTETLNPAGLKNVFATTVSSFQVNTNGTMSVPAVDGGHVARFSATWSTNDAWPSSLPGSAVGSIPS